jgi:hypothetical protein
MSDLAVQRTDWISMKVDRPKYSREVMPEWVSNYEPFYVPRTAMVKSRGHQLTSLYGIHLLLMYSILNSSVYTTGRYAEYAKLIVVMDRSNVPSAPSIARQLVDLCSLNTTKEIKSKSDENGALQSIFEALSKRWKTETSGYSSVGSMVMHPAYLEIISYGDKMIPFILNDLQSKPGHWFIALKTLAKYSPVKPEDAGNIKKMTEAWIEWGRANGKLS